MKKRGIWSILEMRRYSLLENVISILLAIVLVAIIWIARIYWETNRLQWQDVSITPIAIETEMTTE